MSRGLDHIVHAVRDPDGAAAFYRRLGFTVGARNRHPWGTHNHIVQLPGFFIELLTVAEPEKLGGEGFAAQFGRFNQTFLRAREGFSFLMLESQDAQADARDFAAAGIAISDALTFERDGSGPDGSKRTVGFSLAFARDAGAPAIGFAACRQRQPENFWNPALQQHPNGANAIAGAVMVAENPSDHHIFLSAFTGEREAQCCVRRQSRCTPRAATSASWTAPHSAPISACPGHLTSFRRRTARSHPLYGAGPGGAGGRAHGRARSRIFCIWAMWWWGHRLRWGQPWSSLNGRRALQSGIDRSPCRPLPWSCRMDAKANNNQLPNPIVAVGKACFGNDLPFALIAGPCVLESRAHALEMAAALKELTGRLGIGFVFKTSFDKANRTSAASARGLGLKAALPIFAEIRLSLGVPVLTDVHESAQCARVAEVVDVLQIPAFLSRQTDLLLAVAAATGRIVNVKKGQFLAPWDMANVVAKITQAGNPNVLVTERGASFGYNTLVSDMRARCRSSRAPRPGAGDLRCDAFGAAAGRARNLRRAASASSFRCSPAPPCKRSASPDSSSRPTRTRTNAPLRWAEHDAAQADGGFASRNPDAGRSTSWRRASPRNYAGEKRERKERSSHTCPALAQHYAQGRSMLHCARQKRRNLEPREPHHSCHPQNRRPGGVRIHHLHAGGRSADPQNRGRPRHRCEDRGAALDRLHVSLCAGAAGAGRFRGSFRQDPADEHLPPGGGAGRDRVRGGDQLLAAGGHAGRRRMRCRRPVSDRACARRRSGASAAASGRNRASARGRAHRQSPGRIHRRHDRRLCGLARRVRDRSGCLPSS